MCHFASKGGYYLSAAFIQERPLIEHIRYICKSSVCIKRLLAVRVFNRRLSLSVILANTMCTCMICIAVKVSIILYRSNNYWIYVAISSYLLSKSV